jgi:hypothetical protein
MNRAKWKGGPVAHDPTIRTKGGTPKRTKRPVKPPIEVVFNSLIVREVDRPPIEQRHRSDGLTNLNDWDLPYYLQLATATKVAKTLKLGETRSGHEVLADVDAKGCILGIEVV